MFKLQVGYESNTLGDGPDDNERANAEIATAKWTGELLDRGYPGHPWAVEVQMAATGGIIKIQLRGLMPPDRWYVCHLSDVLTDPGGKRTVLRGAGEILERYKIPRQRFNADDWKGAMSLIKPTQRGHLAPLL